MTNNKFELGSRCQCEGCDTLYSSPEWIEVVVPEAYWLLISPTGGDGGLLCFQCMERLYASLGFGTIHPPVPFRLYYPGGSMKSELYNGYNEDSEKSKQLRLEWMSQPVRKNK